MLLFFLTNINRRSLQYCYTHTCEAFSRVSLCIWRLPSSRSSLTSEPRRLSSLLPLGLQASATTSAKSTGTTTVLHTMIHPALTGISGRRQIWDHWGRATLVSMYMTLNSNSVVNIAFADCRHLLLLRICYMVFWESAFENILERMNRKIKLEFPLHEKRAWEIKRSSGYKLCCSMCKSSPPRITIYFFFLRIPRTTKFEL